MDKALPLDANLSHYRIISKLGAGGMVKVHLAHETKLDRKVALKIFRSHISHRESWIGFATSLLKSHVTSKRAVKLDSCREVG